jgi:hypothetical protein
MYISGLGQQEVAITGQQPSGGIAQSQKTSVKSTQTAEIEIYTAEGDKVTLSSMIQFEASAESYASYEHLGRSYKSHHHRRDGHGPGHQQNAISGNSSASVSSTQKYSVSIEGNLNQQELQDIQKALQMIKQASQKIESGNLDGAQNKLEKLGELKSLTALSADISVEQSVTVEKGINIQAAA